MRNPGPDDVLRRQLEASPPARLVELLLEHAARDDDLRERLLIEAARDGRGRIDPHAFRRTIDDAIFEAGTGHRGYGYTSSGWASAVDAVTERLRALIDAGFAADAVELTEYALDSLEQAMDHMDDSDGYFVEVRETLEDVHHAACVAARPDPVALAGRLFAHEADGGWEIFFDAVDRYADILGSAGVAEYRRLAEERWEKLSPLTPEDRTRGHEPGRFAVTRIMEVLARRDGDVEALLAVKRRDLSSPYDFLEIAELLRSAGRESEAIEWAERGVAAFPDWRDERLDIFLCDAYQQDGRHDAALELAWRRFVARPKLDEYRFLTDVASRAGTWDGWRPRAIASLESGADNEATAGVPPGASLARGNADMRRRDTLVEVLLWERRVDEAWAEATERNCSHFVWMLLAAARESEHPADAIPIYQREVEILAARKNNHAYAETVTLLRRIRDLFARSDRSNDFTDYVAAMRETHRRKRNLMKLLDIERW